MTVLHRLRVEDFVFKLCIGEGVLQGFYNTTYNASKYSQGFVLINILVGSLQTNKETNETNVKTFYRETYFLQTNLRPCSANRAHHFTFYFYTP